MNARRPGGLACRRAGHDRDR